MSQWIIYKEDTHEILDVAHSSGSANIFLGYWQRQYTISKFLTIKLEETELSVREWKMWKTLSK